jgi:DNA-binding NtrC family response regulator
VPIIIITGYATVETAVEAMKEGAVDYIAKPFTPEEICDKIRTTMEQRPAQINDLLLHKELLQHHGFDQFVGMSAEMQRVYRRILQVAPTDSTVLITGESGTGKELVARSVHAQSQRCEQPFVAVDCTSLAENLLESELFGHVKGSFTGAIQTKTGLFKVADRGTLFLDEIGNLSLTIQAKLLRVLQSREVTPIGSTQPIPIDIRLVAATNRSLRELVARGEFREDLFFRLNIIPVELPPLRERRGDIKLLAMHFLKRFAEEFGRDIRSFSPEALDLLERYSFPGNVRELENLVERATVLAAGLAIRSEDLELNTPEANKATHASIPFSFDELRERKRVLREQAVEPLERAFLIEALNRNDWNITRAAQEVGMLRPNFQALLKKQGIVSRDRPLN